MVMCCPLSSSDEAPYENVEQFMTTDFAAAHACCECGETIATGVTYEHYEGTNPESDPDDADPDVDPVDVYRTCTLCVEIRDHFECGGWIFGQLWQDLQDNFFPDMRMGGPCMAGLSPAAKSALVDARLEWVMDGGTYIAVALPPWWRWWYGDAELDEGRF